MNFSLSSSLVGRAVLNPDKLSLDLQFAADKTLTARSQPQSNHSTMRQCQRLNTKVGSLGSVRIPNANMQLRW
jgi:hypothetical protein